LSRRRKNGYLAVVVLLLVLSGVGHLIGPPQSASEAGRPKAAQERPKEPPPPETVAVLPTQRPVAVRRDNAKQLQVRVVGVHDGDTLTGLDESKTQFKVRLDAIAPLNLASHLGRLQREP